MPPSEPLTVGQVVAAIGWPCLLMLTAAVMGGLYGFMKFLFFVFYGEE